MCTKVYTEAVHCVYRSWNTNVITSLRVCTKVCRSSPSLRSTWNTNFITGLRMCSRVCTEAVRCAALERRKWSWVCACVYQRMYRSSLLRTALKDERYQGFAHVYQRMNRSSPWRSAWNTIFITGLHMCTTGCTEAAHYIFSTWNTNVNVTGLRMCTKVCTEAAHYCAALGTRTLSRVCACVPEFVPRQSIA